MSASYCKVCGNTLMARVVHWEDRDGKREATMWKDMLSYETASLASNEAVEELWCPDCGIQYHVD